MSAKSVHGEFGPAAAWESTFRPYVQAWLARPASKEEIKGAIAVLARATQWEGNNYPEAEVARLNPFRLLR